jgi:hypothetical protein
MSKLDIVSLYIPVVTDYLTNLPTNQPANFMEQGPSWETDSSSVSQGILHIS